MIHEKSDMATDAKPRTTLPGTVEKIIKSPDPNEPEKAEIAATRMRNDLERTHRISDQLDSEDYPPQLLAVVAYLRRQLRFQLWLGEQEIRFAETGALPQSDGYGVSVCRATAERASRERANGGCSVMGSWTNCILSSNAPRLGRYPKAQFRAFLNAKGIRILKWEGIGD
jgi:hypothetical protein